MIRIMIVDDQKIFKEGLKMIISLDDDIEVVSLCENGREAVESVELFKPDIILMDIRMPILNGVEAVKVIKNINESINVIMLTTFHDEFYIYEAIKNGASGYLLKDTSIDVIIKTIKTVYNGGALIDPDITKVILNQFTKLARSVNTKNTEKIKDILTEREIEVSKLVSEGMNNKEISGKLFLGEGTVKNHLTRILQKLELRDRTQLAIFVLKLNL